MLEKNSKKQQVSSKHQENLYLCNFQVTVAGDWLCLKKVEENASKFEKSNFEMRGNQQQRENFKRRSISLTTPEHEQIIQYPDYPLGKRGILSFKIVH